MKHIFVALAAVGLWVSGCGPAQDTQEAMGETGSVEQRLTPCLADCYPGCTGTRDQINECRAQCRVDCAGT